MSLKSETATKSDIEAFRAEMKTEIATAVDPFKDQMSDFRSRLAAVEARSSSGFSKQQIQLLNSVDIAIQTKDIP
eukprot:4199137-Pyramimonas_sp.AAC.1